MTGFNGKEFVRQMVVALPVCLLIFLIFGFVGTVTGLNSHFWYQLLVGFVSAYTSVSIARRVTQRSTRGGRVDVAFRMWADATRPASLTAGEWEPQARAEWNRRFERDEMSVARHEAAHAVVGHRLGQVVIMTSIVDKNGLSGSTIVFPRERGDSVELFCDVISTLAGMVVDRRAGLNLAGSGHDVDEAARSAHMIALTGSFPDGWDQPCTSDAVLEGAWSHACRLVSECERDINRVALALMEEKMLTASEIRKLLDRDNSDS